MPVLQRSTLACVTSRARGAHCFPHALRRCHYKNGSGLCTAITGPGAYGECHGEDSDSATTYHRIVTTYLNKPCDVIGELSPQCAGPAQDPAPDRVGPGAAPRGRSGRARAAEGARSAIRAGAIWGGAGRAGRPRMETAPPIARTGCRAALTFAISGRGRRAEEAAACPGPRAAPGRRRTTRR